MIYLIIGMSVLFIAIGFIVTENNAKYLLSGYNTMSDEDQKKLDLKAYIPYFRSFHIFLAISFLLLGVAITYFINENAGGVFSGIYPIVAYIYFMVTSAKYSKGRAKKYNRAGIVILVVVMLFVIALIGYGFKEDKLIFDGSAIEFKGVYGEAIKKSEIQSIELVNELPQIILKTNGFALGTVRKGYFRTRSGEVIKLILNSNGKPIVLLTKANGKRIYYSAKDKSGDQVMNEIKKTLPDIVYK